MSEDKKPSFMEEVSKLEAVKLLDVARMTEAAEQYDQMCLVMKEFVGKKAGSGKAKLEAEERNMLSVAFKNSVGQRRAAWRQLQMRKQELENPSSENEGKLAQTLCIAYCTHLEGEMDHKCNQVVSLVNDKLIDPNSEDSETQVFYMKMCGDYFRYLAEFKQNDDGIKKKAKESYDQALTLAEEKLDPTHPTRLGLALNASVCFYEILKNKEQACKLAKKAFDEAIQKLDALTDSTYKDSTLIMQLLRDNLTLWQSESDNAQVTEEQQD